MSITATRPVWRWPDTCTVERDANAGTQETWGNPVSPNWQPHLVDLTCRSWVDAGREPVDSDRTVTIVDRRVHAARGTDVTTRDRVVGISERGTVVAAGPWGIEAVLERRDHLELVLQEIG